MRFEAVKRVRRAVGGVCAAVVVGVVSFVSAGARAELTTDDHPRERKEPASDSWRGSRNPVWLESEDRAEPPILVYPPSSSSKPEPPLVLLHGMCGHPENECPWFAGSATESRWVACPRADLSCNGGGSIWSGTATTREALVNSTEVRLEKAFAGNAGWSQGGILVGFSLGAFVALDVAQASHGQWKRLMLIGAFVQPNAKRLKAAGVESVLLASGDWDMSRDEMKKQARALEREGVRARYMGMGPVGHRFAKDMDTWLLGAVGWLEEAPIAESGGARDDGLYGRESTVR